MDSDTFERSGFIRHCETDARPAFLHAADTAAFDASSFLLFFGWQRFVAAVVVDWQVIDAVAAALHERRVIFQAAPRRV